MGQTVARGAHEDAPLGGAVIRRHRGGLASREVVDAASSIGRSYATAAEPQGAAHGEDDGVEAFSVSASASYSC